VIYGGSGSNGEILNIQSADGTSILTYQIPRAYSQMTVLFSSPNLTSGGSYTISKGGTVSGGSEFFGLYSGGTYSGGTQAATFTATSMVTQVGSTSGGGAGALSLNHARSSVYGSVSLRSALFLEDWELVTELLKAGATAHA
jgi:hypothetical protein